jgi:hypothetical protein
LLIVLLAAGLAGCQTANRFAWWKHNNAPEDTSLVARSAAPTLPSTQATPETLTASREAGGKAPTYTASVAAVPPSAKSVPTSSAATIFNAPTASYAGGPPSTSPAVPGLPPTTASTPTTTTPPATPPNVMAQTSPYDPNAYQGSQSAVAQAPSASTELGMSENRYGESMPDRYGATAPSASMPEAPTAVASNASPDHYGLGSTPAAPAASGSQSAGGEVDRYGLSTTPSVTPPAAAPPVTAMPVASQPVVASAAVGVQQAPPATAPSVPADSIPSAMASVQITSLPGQYRPGGTSSFQPFSPPTQTEIASRAPNAAATSAPSVPATTPGAPPAYPATPSPSASGLRPY